MDKNNVGHKKFDDLADVLPGRETWRIQVRVLRLWYVPSFVNPEENNSMEMVLVDEKGGKIHATVRKQLLYLFESKICEGETYQMSFFFVAPSSGSYRTTLHPYKLIFQMKTKVQKGDGSAISVYGLSLTKIAEICSHDHDYDYLVDVIGLVTGISTEREYIRDGKITKMIVVELTDDSGKCECALFGDYVDDLKKLMGKAVDGSPICVIQFAKVKIFRDKAAIQNVINTTRIMINPDVPECIAFKKRMDILGIEPPAEVPLIGSRARPSMEEEFLNMYPKKTIAEISDTDVEGNCVVAGTVLKLVDGQEWWYPACKCHKSVTPDSGAYYCNACARHVFQIVPRFKVKLQVTDGDAEVVLVLFDNDISYIVEKSCANLVAVAKSENAGFYPPEFDSLIGKKFLFVVDPKSASTPMSDGSYRVKRTCMDSIIIQKFADDVPEITPVKSTLPDSDDLSDDVEIVEETQTTDFVDGCITTPELIKKTATYRQVGSSVKRNLTKVFEEMPPKKKKRLLKAVKIEED